MLRKILNRRIIGLRTFSNKDQNKNSGFLFDFSEGNNKESNPGNKKNKKGNQNDNKRDRNKRESQSNSKGNNNKNQKNQKSEKKNQEEENPKFKLLFSNIEEPE